jgi:hypothetical protein
MMIPLIGILENSTRKPKYKIPTVFNGKTHAKNKKYRPHHTQSTRTPTHTHCCIDHLNTSGPRSHTLTLRSSVGHQLLHPRRARPVSSLPPSPRAVDRGREVDVFNAVNKGKQNNLVAQTGLLSSNGRLVCICFHYVDCSASK